MEELQKLNKVRAYCEAPAKPDFFDTSLLLIGGKNPLSEPMLRVSWGWDLRTFRNGDPQALKYPGPFLERWILEKWLPAEFFGTKRQWEQHRYMKAGDGRHIDLLGEFPRQGSYGMVMPIVDPDGGFIPLSSDVLLFIDRMQSEFNSRTLNVYSDAKLYARLQEQMAEEEARLEVNVEAKVKSFEDYVVTREGQINTDRSYLMPSSYRDETGATHTLWEDSDGTANARIDFTMPTKEGDE